SRRGCSGSVRGGSPAGERVCRCRSAGFGQPARRSACDLALVGADRAAEVIPRGALAGRVRYVDDGDVITAAGVLSGVDATLRVVERMAGPVAGWEGAQAG